VERRASPKPVKKAETEDEADAHKAEAWEQTTPPRGSWATSPCCVTCATSSTSVPHLVDDVIDLLADERLDEALARLSRSVLPRALEALEKEHPHGVLRVIAALSDAVDLSLTNVPRFSGKTLVALDGSGSMMGRPHKDRIAVRIRPRKANDADVMLLQVMMRSMSRSTNAIAPSRSPARWVESQYASAGTTYFAQHLPACESRRV